MASSSPQLELDELTGRRFSFYPTILNIEHNEWTLAKDTWSEVLVANVASGLEIWIPRTYLGSISKTDSPVLIVGLTRELEWKAGKIWPHQKRLIEMPTRRSAAETEVAPGPAPARRESVAESSVGRFMMIALAVGLLACLLVVIWAFGGLRNPLDVFFAVDTTTTDQLYLSLTGRDGYVEVVEKVGRPESEQWISKPEGAIQFQVLTYPSRSYALVLMGPNRKQAHYIGTLHVPSRKILDSVKLYGGGSTSSMLRNLPAF